MSTQEPPDTDEQTSDDDTDSDDPFLDVEISTDAIQVIVDAVDAANEETVIEFTEDGMHTNVADRGNVMLADTFVEPDAFERYDVSGEITVGVRLSKLDNFATIGDTTELSYDPQLAKFEIDSGPAHVSAASMDPESMPTREVVGDMYEQSQAHWKQPASDFYTALDATTSVHGKTTEVHASPEDSVDRPIRFEKDGDTDDMVVEMPNASYVTEPPEDQRSLMSEDYLKNIKQAIPSKDTELEVWTSTDFPLLLEYQKDGVYVTFMQAPRLEGT